MPNDYHKSEVQKSAYGVSNGPIEKSVTITKSKQGDSKGKWYLEFFIDLRNPYQPKVPEGTCQSLMNATLFEEKVVSLWNIERVPTCWDENQEEEVERVLKSIGLPWLDWISSTDTLIEYYEGMINWGDESHNSFMLDRFGDMVLFNSQVPQKHRDKHHCYLSILNEHVGNHKAAIDHLKKFLDYKKQVNTPTANKTLNDEFTEEFKLIEIGIERLTKLVD